MGRRLAILCSCSFFAASTATAASPQIVRLERTLKTNLVAAFAQQATPLQFTTVRCTLPAAAVVHCTARFTAPRATGYYRVTATVTHGVLRWRAASPRCFDARTKRPIGC
jgi:hypothetical protein